MKKVYWLSVFFCLAPAFLSLTGVSRAQTQSTNAAGGALDQTAEARLMVPYQSYAQYAFDMVLRYQNDFIGSALNPDEYIVGPGDRFTVSFVSADIGDIACRINLGGRMFIKSVGSVDLHGKTLLETLETIRQAVAKKYQGSEFAVNMTGFRFVPVHVVGEVVNPGIYYAPAPWRTSEVIEMAGGLTPKALSRKIILRGEEKSLPVDLVRFAAVGDKTANPMVCAGNTIYVPNSKECTEYVTVTGLVNRPGIFAALKDDHISDYLLYAGGAAGNLADMIVAITNPDADDPLILDGAQLADMDRSPHPGDNISVRWKNGSTHHGDVVILGAVANPGRYPMTGKDFTFADLLQSCGGYRPDGSRDLVQVFRLTRDNATASQADASYNIGVMAGANSSARTRLSLDPRRPGDLSELKLADGDSVFVPFMTGMITVTGAVASPGLVQYREGQAVDYYLKAAGGLGFDADKTRMVVYNPATGGRISAASAGQLFDGEVLIVPRKESSDKP